MEVEFYLAQVILEQGPINQEREVIFDYENRVNIEIPKTWLRNYFRDLTVYGLELSTDGEKLNWKFFLRAENEQEANNKGNSLLLYLEKLFPGLTGTLITLPIYSGFVYQEFTLYELVIPKMILINTGKFALIKEFIHNFRKNRKKDQISTLYILWQKDDALERGQRYRIPINDLFKVKIYFGFYFKSNNNLLNKDLIQDQLEFLTMDIYDATNERAYFKFAPRNTQRRILNGNVFIRNEDNKLTGKQYHIIWDSIPEELQFYYLKPKMLDFNFPKYSGLTKPLMWDDTNIISYPISKENENFICVGKVIEQGVVNNQYAFIDKNHFSLSMFIGGVSGAGKTREICQIQHEFYEKCPDIGILTVYLGNKRNQDIYYKSDIILRYKEFGVPYFVKGPDVRQCIFDTATYLAAIVGIRVVETNLINVMQNYGADKIPKQLGELYGGLLDWFEEHPYHDKFQKDITQLIKDRVYRVLGDINLQKTVELTHELPSWYNEWRKGKKIFLDMSMCSIDAKRLIVSALLQMIIALAPRVSDTDQLKNLIVIDEAHQIMERAKISPHYYDVEAITRDQLEKVFKNLLNEFRARGLAFIIADQEPHKLFDDVATSPSLKILFRLDGSSSKLFNALTMEEQKKLTRQKFRNALILNGATGEKYAIRTLNI